MSEQTVMAKLTDAIEEIFRASMDTSLSLDKREALNLVLEELRKIQAELYQIL